MEVLRLEIFTGPDEEEMVKRLNEEKPFPFVAYISDGVGTPHIAEVFPNWISRQKDTSFLVIRGITKIERGGEDGPVLIVYDCVKKCGNLFFYPLSLFSRSGSKS